MKTDTKKELSDALIELLKTKPLSKITVSNITDECGTSRMTFYYHFNNVNQLVAWTCEQAIGEAMVDLSSYETWQEGLRKLFQVMLDKKELFYNIYHSASHQDIESFLYYHGSRLLMNIMATHCKDIHVSEENKEFIVNFYKYGCTGVITNWIDTGMSDDPEVLIDKLSTVMEGEFARALQAFEAQDTADTASGMHKK